jgi:LPXTG-motif cell wall-anchored protein
MKRIFAALIALFIAALGAVALASPASATGNGDTPDADNKKVTLCHATSSETNPYNLITVSVNAFYNAGHIDHEGDIWEAFSYTTKGGDVVNVPARGNTDLLNYPDCVQPKVDEVITPPALNAVDKCGSDKDTVSVADSADKNKYTVGPVTGTAPNFSVVVTAKDGFKFAGGKTVTLTTTAADFPNSDDCGLPETGSEATYATGIGVAALAAVALLGMGLYNTRRRNAE